MGSWNSFFSGAVSVRSSDQACSIFGDRIDYLPFAVGPRLPGSSLGYRSNSGGIQPGTPSPGTARGAPRFGQCGFPGTVSIPYDGHHQRVTWKRSSSVMVRRKNGLRCPRRIFGFCGDGIDVGGE